MGCGGGQERTDGHRILRKSPRLPPPARPDEGRLSTFLCPTDQDGLSPRTFFGTVTNVLHRNGRRPDAGVHMWSWFHGDIAALRIEQRERLIVCRGLQY
jgi:hypothetical protein